MYARLDSAMLNELDAEFSPRTVLAGNANCPANHIRHSWKLSVALQTSNLPTTPSSVHIAKSSLWRNRPQGVLQRILVESILYQSLAKRLTQSSELRGRTSSARTGTSVWRAGQGNITGIWRGWGVSGGGLIGAQSRSAVRPCSYQK